MSLSALPHAPFGAQASFDFGPVGAPAGFVQPAGTALMSTQSIFVGCRASAREAWSLLPFFSPVPSGPQPLPKGRYGRFLAWAGDKWMIGPLVFKLCTPFSATPDLSDDAFLHAPVVCGYLEYDNSHSDDTAELIFGLGGLVGATDLRVLSGFVFGGAHGFATAPSSEVEARRDAALFGDEIGPATGLHFTVPPRSKRIYPLVLGFFQTGFHYGQYFADLTAVLTYGQTNHVRYLALADARDAEFMRSTMAFDAKTRAAAEIRQWHAATRRLAGEPEIDLAPLRAFCRAVTG